MFSHLSGRDIYLSCEKEPILKNLLISRATEVRKESLIFCLSNSALLLQNTFQSFISLEYQ